MKRRFRGTSVVRLVRLVLGCMALVQGLLLKDLLFEAAGGVLVLMVLFNVGCFGNSCPIAAAKDKQANQHQGWSARLII